MGQLVCMNESLRFQIMRRLKRTPSKTLLFVQLIALLIYPMVESHIAGQLIVTVISTGVLATAVWLVRRSPRSGYIAAGLALTGTLFYAISLVAPQLSWCGLIGAAGFALAYFYSAVSLVSYMMMDEHTTTDEMWAAGAVFMLFAEGWAWVFLGCQLYQPGSFVLIGKEQNPLSWTELLFLSATNFSATGLSDILPTTPWSRILIVIAQWNGVMYLTIVVARLAGSLRRKVK